jgi:hypothetical protein
MATLDQAMQELSDLVGGLSGMKATPDYPPESMNQFPFGVVYPASGEWGLYGAAWSIDFHELIVEIHLTRGILPTAVAAAMPFYERFRNALGNDPTLGGTVQTIHGLDRPIRYEFGLLNWAGKRGQPETHIGWRFRLTVKLHSTLS